MYSYTNTLYGSMAIDIKDNKLQGKFVTSTGSVFDSFTIIKNAGGSKTYTVCPNEPFVLKSTFPDQVSWFPSSQQADSITISTPVSTVYYATDLAGCIKDTFNISVISNPNCNPAGIEDINTNPFKLYPTYMSASTNYIVIESGFRVASKIKLYDLNGKDLFSEKIDLEEGKNKLNIPVKISTGMYFINITTATYQQETMQKLQTQGLVLTMQRVYDFLLWTRSRLLQHKTPVH